MFVKQEVAMKKAAIVMGSDSDLGKVKSAALTLKELGIPFEMRIISAHRTPAEAADFAQNAEKNGFGVLISAAGKAAHLAGALAAIDGARNAALLAAQMLSLCDDELREKLRALREKNTQAVIEKDRKLQDELEKILEA